MYIHTLPPDLRCNGWVCHLLRTAAPTSAGPAEHSAPYDCGGRVVRQKRRDRQRHESRNPRRVRKDAGATCLHLATQPSTTVRPTDKRISAPMRPVSKSSNEEKVLIPAPAPAAECGRPANERRQIAAPAT
ncbi:hypothetical protein EVAR_34556_1 [Eumeta japonica]|uniref:Uncharacterized protein n=1 Tax=Eumeta variegata TaxID=151549 RepID=A0A4C1X892_EUMVA|nr:hypothetical protein EVAR_34556_1 [Eumeta japonica]